MKKKTGRLRIVRRTVFRKTVREKNKVVNKIKKDRGKLLLPVKESKRPKGFRISYKEWTRK